MVRRQVRNPRFQTPAFNTTLISDEELDQIAAYNSGLECREYLDMETSDLSAAVEMHP